MTPYTLGAQCALTLLKIAAPVLRTGVRLGNPQSEMQRQLSKINNSAQQPEFDLSKMVERVTKLTG